MSGQKELELRKGSAVMQRTVSTPLRPAVWMTSVLAWATVIALLFRVPTWGGIFLCTLTGLSFLLYLFFYIYLMINDRQSLRRERLKAKGPQMSERDSLASVSTGLIDHQQHSALESLQTSNITKTSQPR